MDTCLMAFFLGQPGYIGTRNVKRIWILMKQEMRMWQWHQSDNMQITCILLQTDNRASTSSLNFFYRIDALSDVQRTLKASFPVHVFLCILIFVFCWYCCRQRRIWSFLQERSCQETSCWEERVCWCREVDAVQAKTRLSLVFCSCERQYRKAIRAGVKC